MPPIHPAIVHFPIALITFALIAECVGYFRDNANARTVAWWSWVAALISGVITLAAGYYDLIRASLADETRTLVQMHLRVGLLLATVLLVVTLWRWVIRRNVAQHPGPGFITLAVLLFALTFFQGWFGSEMAYAHGAGVAAAGQGMRPEAEAQQRLAGAVRLLSKVPGLRPGDLRSSKEDEEAPPAVAEPPDSVER